MPIDHRSVLAKIRRFDQLVAYLRDEMGWPIESDDFEEITFTYTPEELGIEAKNRVGIQKIMRLRRLSAKQPWGIFFIKFKPKKLPVVALRRILGKVVIKTRASANSADRAAWAAEDLLFISNYGEGDSRQISFAHFSQDKSKKDLPTLKVLGWDSRDTALHLDHVASVLAERLAWPREENEEKWREQWRAAFTIGHREIINTSKQLSVELARLARDIRDLIKRTLEIETENGPITKLMESFREVLFHDLDEAGFADMYAQTIAYGLLSSRIADPKKATLDDFAAHMRTNPFLRELMETFLRIGGRQGKAGGPGIDFDELGVGEIIDLLDRANMEAILRDFGDRNPDEDPVIHFYEVFLKEYDAKERMQRGVFYTPRPVVSFIVRSVDQSLRDEFGLADGLADTTTWGEMAGRHQGLKVPDGVSPDQDFVQILDPATGTGTFLVEVIDLIHKTLISKWQAEGCRQAEIAKRWNTYVPKHLLPRLYGYELLMAPYAIAHLKIGLKLYETGYKFGSDERARVFLTNALEPASDIQFRLSALPALAHEAQAVNQVKREHSFAVVLGNPPYSGESANKGDWIMGLMEAYKKEPGGFEKLKERNPKWINDDYVKFIRLAEHMIEKNGEGVLGFITNHGYLDNPTFRGMRWHLLKTFDKIYVLDLHGNSKKKEVAPDGSSDKNVFDIMQGVSIIVTVTRTPLLKSDEYETGEDTPLASVYHSDLWGSRAEKYKVLSDITPDTKSFVALTPQPQSFYFVPWNYKLQTEYENGFSVADLMTVNSVGIATARDHFTIQPSPKDVRNIINLFLTKDDEENRAHFKLGKDARDWKVSFARDDLTKSGPNWANITRCLYRPFDVQYTYFTGRSRGFHCMPRGDVMRHYVGHKNLGLLVSKAHTDRSFAHALITDSVTEVICLSGSTGSNAMNLPLYLYPAEEDLETERRINFNAKIYKKIRGMAVCDRRGMPNELEVFDYVYGVLYCPTYRATYNDFLRKNFPRIPYPTSPGVFWDVSSKGRQLRKLHLMEDKVVGETPYPFMGDGDNMVEKPSFADDGRVLINKAQYFEGVPPIAWEFYIGGYQPAQKWLKDRKGRELSADDIHHYQKIIKILSETDRIMKTIDGSELLLNNQHPPNE